MFSISQRFDVDVSSGTQAAPIHKDPSGRASPFGLDCCLTRCVIMCQVLFFFFTFFVCKLFNFLSGTAAILILPKKKKKRLESTGAMMVFL